MSYLSEKTESFIHVCIVVFTAAAKFNGFKKRIANIFCTCGPSTLLICNIIFDAGARIDFQLTTIDGSTETRIVLTRVSIIGIVFRIVNVFLSTIYAKSF